MLLVAGRWFSSVSSTNKTDRYDITEILSVKVALNTAHPPFHKNFIQPFVYRHKQHKSLCKYTDRRVIQRSDRFTYFCMEADWLMVGWFMVFNATFNEIIFPLYRGDQFYWWRNRRKTHVTGKLYHIILIDWLIFDADDQHILFIYI